MEKFNFVEKRASLQLADGSYKFDKMIDAPDFWSERAVTIAADKYLFGDRENSIAELVLRVASHISQMNRDNIGDLYDDEFYLDLTRMLLNQRAAFNSPVWFNVGVGPKLGVKGSSHNFYWDRETGEILPCNDTYQYPQGAACFIQSVDDTMESIMRLAASEAMLFKYGSGTGTDLSTIRSSRERLSNGGIPSGPLSFMRVYDQIAAVVKSGGKCLTGNQCVYTPDRGPITVRELAEFDKRFLVLSYDPPSGITKVKYASCWQSGSKDCVRVTTDKGVFETSCDHPFILAGSRDALMAKDLKPGMRMFGGRAAERLGYFSFHETGGRKNRELIHRMVARDIVGDDIYGMAVHHIDGDRMNNSPDNLCVLSQEEHASLHGREMALAGEHIFVTQSWPHRGPSNGMHSSSRFYKDSARVNAYKNKQGDILTKSGRAREMQAESSRSKMANHAWKLINMGFEIDTIDEYIRLRQEHLGRIHSRKQVERQVSRNFGSYENMLKYMSENNHVVISIESIGRQPVYSVEVDCDTDDDKSQGSGHNFLIWSLDNDSRVGSGLFVHNTRRAAKMQSLKNAHPDIIEFIECKWREELKAKALVAAGYSSGLDGEAIQSAFYQNSNTSVRVSDEFMRAVEMHETYDTIAVTTGEPVEKLNASKVLMRIAEATWKCGDPGLQFDDTINYWHTCKNSGRINASNPCSEYMFLDDSACNLASLNLIKYLDDHDNFKVLQFAKDIRTLIRSMDALVDGCSYPTAQIAENSHKFRPLGLGYCNLGGLLMALGVPYDSDEGRGIASEITSYMTAIAYHESAMIAIEAGSFDGFARNRESMLEVVSAHWKHSKDLASAGRLIDGMTIDDAWSNACADGRIHGYRNAQVTVLAPTGTISLFMDAETGGIEPFLGLIAYKKLVGGGTLTKASQLVERGLRGLGYDGEHLDKILEYIKNHNHVLTDLVKPEHQGVFETSFGAQALPWKAHVDMMAAVQPFLSGAISKTVNMPNDAIVNDIYNAYHYAWRSGLKSIAIYRDGSKATQPESSKKDDHVVDTNKKIESDHIPDATKMIEPQPVTAEMLEKMKMDFDSVDLQVFDTLRELVSTSGRTRLPDTRNSVTHKFDIAGHEGYLTVGLYKNGQPGELFITISKEGSTIAGLLGVVGTLFSMAVQSGVPLSRICDKFIYSKFEPSGWTNNPEIGYAHSIVDYIFRWLKMRFVDAPIETEEEPMPNKETVKIKIKNSEIVTGDPCKNCGGTTVPSGACWVCTQCGETTGCG